MDKLERVKNQINALLEKTIENGATEEEMFLAMAKAEELMTKYSILKSQLPEKKIKEKCVLVKHPKYKTHFKTEFFIGSLADFFDCEHYWNSYYVTFFGYKEDVKLCIYFYDIILNLCFIEKQKFINSDEGKKLKRSINGRTISASFIKGFLSKIDKRLYQMYKEKKDERNSQERGIILLKKNKVDEEFRELNFTINSVKLNRVVKEMQSYYAGQEQAENVPLNFALENELDNTFLIK